MKTRKEKFLEYAIYPLFFSLGGFIISIWVGLAVHLLVVIIIMSVYIARLENDVKEYENKLENIYKFLKKHNLVRDLSEEEASEILINDWSSKLAKNMRYPS